LVDEDDYDVPDGEIGELVIRAHRPWLMLESYLDRWEATARAWRNGWFHTGDALRRDPAGNYYFVDRIADYVRTRGNNVSSLEVEAEVNAHPQVAATACIGVPSDLATLEVATPDARADQDIKVFVLREPGARLTAAELHAFLEPLMPPYMLPKHIEFVDELPKTPTGKIQKSQLRHR
jgi:crotonobetaine/carnitine-CoA ligase